jgi:hypothetical protein
MDSFLPLGALARSENLETMMLLLMMMMMIRDFSKRVGWLNAEMLMIRDSRPVNVARGSW